MNASEGRLNSAGRGLTKIAVLLFAAAITLVFVSTRNSWAEGEDRGKTTASAVSSFPPGLGGLIDNATVSSDLTVAPSFGPDASRESNRSPGPIG